MKRSALAAVALVLSASAGAQTVDVGTGDWSAVPAVQARGDLRMNDAQMDEIERIAAEARCEVPGLSASGVDISVPFVVRYGQGGTVEQVVLKDVNCPELEVVLGAAVLQLALAGEYRPSGNAPGWYRSQISFANH